VKNPLSENEFKLVTGYNCSDYQSTLVGWTPEIPFQIVFYIYPVCFEIIKIEGIS
jgi:hypothetical protein